jgi:hypothetical protein
VIEEDGKMNWRRNQFVEASIAFLNAQLKLLMAGVEMEQASKLESGSTGQMSIV